MSKAIKGLAKVLSFGMIKDDPKLPAQPKEKPKAPTPDDEESRIAAARNLQRRYATSGRQGTILSDGRLG